MPAERNPAPVALPLNRATVDDLVALLKIEVNKEYTVQREKFMDKTLGSTAEKRKKRSQADQDKDFLKLKKANPVLASADPFKAAWLPTKGDIPSIPPRELMLAAKGPHPLEPKEGLYLEDFMLEHDRLLALSPEELKSLPYLDGWLLRFILTRYFDFASAATRFLKFREMFHKHSLNFNYEDRFANAYNGGFGVSDMFAQFSTNPDFELPPTPELASPATDKEAKKRKKHPYRVNRTPIVLARSKYNDFDKLGFELFKKAWFFWVSMMVASDYYDQTHGFVMIMSGKDGKANPKGREFGQFAAEVTQSAMPVKVQRIFMVHQGFVFNNIVTPLMKLFLSEKVAGKMCTITDDKCPEVVMELGQERTPNDMGGTMELDEGGLKAKQWLFRCMGREWVEPCKEPAQVPAVAVTPAATTAVVAK